MDKAEARQIVQDTVAQHGPEALRDLLPVAITLDMNGCDPTDPRVVMDRTVRHQAMVNPIVAALWTAAGATRHGDRTFSVSLAEDADLQPARVLLTSLRPWLFVPAGAADDGKLQSSVDRKLADRLIGLAIKGAPSGSRLLSDLDVKFTTKRKRRHSTAWQDPNVGQFVELTVAQSRLYAKIATDGTGTRGRGQRTERFHRLPLTVSTAAVPAYYPDQALADLRAAAKTGWPTLDTDGHIVALDTTLRTATVVRSRAGWPSWATVIAPAVEDGGDSPSTLTHMHARDVDLSTAAVVHPAVADVHRMSHVEPSTIDALHDYQRQPFALMNTTDTGAVVAAATGCGKTVLASLTAREHHLRWASRIATETPQMPLPSTYRALVAVPGHLRGQWLSETRRFFPEADAIAVYNGNDVDKVRDALAARRHAEGMLLPPAPLIVIASTTMITQHLDSAFLTTRWCDVFLDESAHLRSRNTKQSEALWRLRDHTDRAYALSATPIETETDDLGQQLCWVRNDRMLFGGGTRPIAKLWPGVGYDTDTAKQFYDSIDPLVIRIDKGAIKDRVPTVETTVVPVTLTPAELRLCDAATSHLKGLLDELVEAVEAHANVSKDSSRYHDVVDALRKAQGAVMGGITLARMAAADPASVTASTSRGVALLKQAGLVAPAVATGGTKRRRVVQTVQQLVASGEGVILFTDFTAVADNLADDLQASGLRVGRVTGGVSPKRRDRVLADYQAGDLDVIVVTKVGQKGLNLTRTPSTLVCFTIGWLATDLVQRIGRIVRIGADPDAVVKVLVVVAQDTVEVRMIRRVIRRGTTASTVLDAARGVDVADTEMGTALAGLSDALPTEDDSADDTPRGVLDRGRALVGA